MSKSLLVSISGMLMLCLNFAAAQPCAAPADITTVPGTNNQWNAYYYRDANFTQYHGRVKYGTPSNPNFDLSLPGLGDDYNPAYDAFQKGHTFKCPLPLQTFSARFLLTKIFTAGAHEFVLGANENARLYIDGNLIIDRFFNYEYEEYSATVSLTAGNHNLVLEYSDVQGDQRIKFKLGAGCLGAVAPEVYGTNNKWYGYLYDGMNFEYYKGRITTGGAGGMLNLTFNNDAVNFATNECPVYTESFSARFMLSKHFEAGYYLFTAGGDDGFRLSIDGGASWLIDEWYDHGFMTSPKVARFLTAGTRDLVLEYYDHAQGNMLYFDIGVTLPVTLTRFEGRVQDHVPLLSWQMSSTSTEDHCTIERSTDGKKFSEIGMLQHSSATVITGGNRQYYYKDLRPAAGAAFYRIRVTDKEGKITYSGIVTINTERLSAIKIYPTIIDQNKQLFIHSGKDLEDAEVVIRNMAGQTIHTQRPGKILSGQVKTLHLSNINLSKGNYLIQLLANNQIVYKSLIFSR